jgi:hypothetical protein
LTTTTVRGGADSVSRAIGLSMRNRPSGATSYDGGSRVGLFSEQQAAIHLMFKVHLANSHAFAGGLLPGAGLRQLSRGC